MISLLLLAAFIVLVIGPWPAYGPGYQEADYFRHSIAAINKSVETLRQGAPDQLMAGWGIADMTPKTGVPLAGYRGRHGKPSIGIHDRLHVEALVVGDGHDMAVIIGADMLMVPENVAGWRVSPILAQILGISRTAWLHSSDWRFASYLHTRRF